MQPSSDTIEGLMPYSNHIATFKDEATSDQGEDDWFLTSEDYFADDSDGGHDDYLEDDWVYYNDILNCNNVESNTIHAEGVNLGDI